jgi:hypothetical protein
MYISITYVFIWLSCLLPSPLLVSLPYYQCWYGCHRVTTDIPVTKFVFLIKDLYVSMVTFPTMLIIACCQHSLAPKSIRTSVFPSLFNDYLCLKFHKSSELIWQVLPKRKTGAQLPNYTASHFKIHNFRLFDSFVTNKIQSIFVITVTDREALRTATDDPKDRRRLQSITLTFISW